MLKIEEWIGGNALADTGIHNIDPTSRSPFRYLVKFHVEFRARDPSETFAQKTVQSIIFHKGHPPAAYWDNFLLDQERVVVSDTLALKLTVKRGCTKIASP